MPSDFHVYREQQNPQGHQSRWPVSTVTPGERDSEKHSNNPVAGGMATLRQLSTAGKRNLGSILCWLPGTNRVQGAVHARVRVPRSGEHFWLMPMRSAKLRVRPYQGDETTQILPNLWLPASLAHYVSFRSATNLQTCQLHADADRR
jgi:hypothetical protein